MAILSSIIGAILAIAVLAIVINAFFFWLAGKVVGIKEATFGRSLLTAIAVGAVTWMLTFLLSIIPGIGTVIGFIIGAILTVFIIKAAFEIKDYGKSFLVWIFYIIAQSIAIFIIILTFGGAVIDMFQS